MKFAALAFLTIVCLFTTSFAEDVPINQGFPFKDGNFSAMLFIIPEKDLKEFDKPVNERLQLHGLSKVKRHEDFAIKIGFTGLAQDAEQKANITFDFKIVEPNGKVIGGEKNLSALQGKIVNPLYLYDTRSEIVVAFDESDKSGAYKIIAEIRDNIAKKSIPLEAQIELVD